MNELLTLLTMVRKRSGADKVYLEVENHIEFRICAVNYHQGKLYQFQRMFTLYMMKDINFELGIFADQAKIAIKQSIDNEATPVIY